MFERPESGTRAVLVHIDFQIVKEKESLGEFSELVRSAAIEPVAIVKGVRKVPDPKYFIGRGKAEEVRDCVAHQQADVVLFNHILTPAQERNLETFLDCRVIDRTGLILDIFAQRASSFEGKLQVELAQLKHLSTRLVRGWTHLERQKGGIGLRGPGETQLETDRRLIGLRIKKLNKQLDKVRKQRDLRRKSRKKAAVKTVSLVGYTNAGKSTLFNKLTGADVFAADQLFATLDPTLRRLKLPAVGEVILTDTVGFIRHLPHNLVAAFRATLEETVEAGLLLHVIDAHDQNREDNIKQVNEVLTEIEADSVIQIEIYNKIDLLDGVSPHVDYDQDGRPLRIWLSAESGEGLDLLKQVLTDHFLKESVDTSVAARDFPEMKSHNTDMVLKRNILIMPEAARLRARLYDWDVVLGETPGQQGETVLEIKATPKLFDFLSGQPGCYIDKPDKVDTAINA